MGDSKSDGEGSVTRADDLDPADRGYGSGGAGYGGAGTGAGQGEPGSGGAGRPDERPAGQAGSVYDPGSVAGSGPEAGEVQGPDDAPEIEASPQDGESQDEIALSSTNTRLPSDVETQESTGADDKPGAGL
jgi:hypothetical protein